MSQEIAFIFPGQGSQSVGMGKDWADAYPAARQTFEEADDVLGFKLSELCWQGPSDDLQLTANTQPAILTCSIAMARVLAELDAPAPVAMAGHSLGEYSALVTAGCLELADALRLVRRRGELMQQAVPVGVGAMAAIMGLEQDAVEQVLRTVQEATVSDFTVSEAADSEVADSAASQEVCSLANINSPQQMVIAGHVGAVDRAVIAAKEAGARIAKKLPVSAPFHSPLMAPAREHLTPDLRATEFRPPRIPVITNIDAQPAADGAGACDALQRQVDGPVRWVESIRYLIDHQGVGTFVEVGPGKVLTGLGKRIDREVRWQALPAPDALAELISELS